MGIDNCVCVKLLTVRELDSTRNMATVGRNHEMPDVDQCFVSLTAFSAWRAALFTAVMDLRGGKGKGSA